jgi:hypothetical protein
MSQKEYLGDGVYAAFDGNGVILTTENGIRATNTIYLESATWDELKKFVGRIEKGEL